MVSCWMVLMADRPLVSCLYVMIVTRALNPSLVGIEGIVARETESTFVIVTKSQHTQPKKSRKLVKSERHCLYSFYFAPSLIHFSSLPVIPKHSSVFSLQIPLPPGAIHGASPHQQHEIRVPLYGNQLCNNMQSRATKKFKARKTIDL
jgi:RNase P/RNase MRP subunit p29